MRTRLRVAAAGVALGAGLLLLVLGRRHVNPGKASAPTFAEHVAPIMYVKCAPCHHPNGAGPFSLVTFAEVSDHRDQIATVTKDRYMPPWKAAAGEPAYANDRSLSEAELAVIQRWIAQGALQGDPAKTPPAPTWSDGWQLGPPDLVLSLEEPFPLQAEGRDVYRNFVIPVNVPKQRFVAAWELRTETRVVHHALINIDRQGYARKRDKEDPGPGFGGIDVGDVSSADGHYLVWTPGRVPTPPRPGVAFRLDPGVDLVLQLHLQPSGKAEAISPKLALYFTDTPPTERRYSLRIGDPPIDIAPGNANYVVTDTQSLPAAVSLLSVFPHAHYLARKFEVWAKTPGAADRNVLRIDDWDFNWQDEYVLATPMELPAGTQLSMRVTYDNSAANPRNPNHPPKQVKTGESSADEMGNVTFQLVPKDKRAMDLLREHRSRKLVAQDGSARNYYNLGNALVDLGRHDEALAAYASALEKDPSMVPVHMNLGNLLGMRGDLEGSVREYRLAVKLSPSDASARARLAYALQKKGDRAEALATYREALKLRPNDAQISAKIAELER